MLRPRIKTLIVAMLLMFSCSQIARAEMKVYQYDGKLPFVQMMLNMMVAMGILDRLPANGAYGGYGASGYPSAWTGLSNPYVRALAMRGISPGSHGNNPFSRSPWLQSPWSQSGASGISPVWGSPSWGVLPVDSYSLHNRNLGSAYGAPAYSPHWSANDIDGWVNEPWENSAWNSAASPVARSQTPQTSQQVQSQPAPLVQNFNFVAPQNGKDNNRGSKSQNSSPLAKLARPLQMPRQSNPAKAKPSASYKKHRPSSSRNTVRQKPCITEFCGLKKPNLDGLWVAKNGEMLGVKNHRYLWSDGNSRYLTGQLKIQNEYLVANIDGHETLMRFKYKLAGNHLMTMQEDGVVREFVRTSGNQYGYPNNNRYSNNSRYYQ